MLTNLTQSNKLCELRKPDCSFVLRTSTAGNPQFQLGLHLYGIYKNICVPRKWGQKKGAQMSPGGSYCLNLLRAQIQVKVILKLELVKFCLN
jgi:hypothetical protein